MSRRIPKTVRATLLHMYRQDPAPVRWHPSLNPLIARDLAHVWGTEITPDWSGKVYTLTEHGRAVARQLLRETAS